MKDPMVLVLDCGATNVRAIAVNKIGELVHAERDQNGPVPQKARHAAGDGWLIWDFEAIWNKLIACAKKTVRRVGKENVASIVVTAFSDDGAPVDRGGNLLYPVISWHCPRTIEIAESIDKHIPFHELYRITGEQIMRQHTLFRLLWFKKHHPGLLEKAHKYLMVPGLINLRLTGEMTNDPTTADSMMLLDIRKRQYAPEILNRIGLDESLFAALVEPGTLVGSVTHSMARELGLKRGTPVFAGGHDTQFALCGSGCRPGEAVLSSGTWEILFLRSKTPNTTDVAREAGLKNECDAVDGLFNVGFQWIGSGALEWVAKTFYRTESEGTSAYDPMVSEAARLPPGGNGVMVHPSMLPGSGISRLHNTAGTILGCTLQTTRGEIYLAFLEGLSFQLRMALDLLRELVGFDPPELTIVGGGSRNRLWNKTRADVLDRPIRFTQQEESTVIGAAVFGFVGMGVYRDFHEAFESINFFKGYVEPSPDRQIYEQLFVRFKEFGPRLEWFYNW